MATVLLVGLSGPTLNVVSGLLNSVGCHILLAAAPRQHRRYIKLTLAITEFCPQDLPLPEFINRVRLLQPLQTLVIGPDLPEDQMAQILAPQHVVRYLQTATLTHQSREALKDWLPEAGRNVLKLGPLQMNLQDQTVHYGAQLLMFTPTEVRLLQVLMQRPGQHTACDTLEALVRCHNVQAHLGNVRRKLNMHSAVPMLRGNPGQGYTLDARRYTRHRADPGAALRIQLRSLM